MIAKGNKRKSLANINEPPNKSPKVKNNTPAKLPAQVKTPQGKPGAKGAVQKQNAKQKISVSVQQSDDDEDDDDDAEEMSDLESLDIEEGSADDLDLDKEDIGDFSDNSEVEGGSDDDDDEDVVGVEDDDEEDEVEGSDDDVQNVDSDDEDKDESEEIEGAIDEEDSNDEEEEENDKETGDTKEPKTLGKPNQKKGGKQRYVVFVGNIPYTATTDIIREHFKEVGPIVDVRVVTHRNQKPKGFCFVEFQDSQSYEKSLSLHHSFLSGRRINVEYTGAKGTGGDKKKENQKKNFKLQALQKAGKLEGGANPNQKRGARRAIGNKAKMAKVEED